METIWKDLEKEYSLGNFKIWIKSSL